MKKVVVVFALIVTVLTVINIIYKDDLKNTSNIVDERRLISSDPRVEEHQKYKEGTKEREAVYTLEKYFNILMEEYVFEESLEFIDQETLSGNMYNELKSEATLQRPLLKYDIIAPSCWDYDGSEECLVEVYMQFDTFLGGIQKYQLVKRDNNWFIKFRDIDDENYDF